MVRVHWWTVHPAIHRPPQSTITWWTLQASATAVLTPVDVERVKISCPRVVFVLDVWRGLWPTASATGDTRTPKRKRHMSHVTVLGVNVNARTVSCTHMTRWVTSVVQKKRTRHDYCALHWPSPCTPHALQRLGRRNAVCETDFIPSVAPSHVLRRRKPMLVRDDRGVAQHGHGVQTRTWKQWHRLFGRLCNGATATRPVQQYDAFITREDLGRF